MKKCVLDGEVWERVGTVSSLLEVLLRSTQEVLKIASLILLMRPRKASGDSGLAPVETANSAISTLLPAEASLGLSRQQPQSVQIR